MAETFGPYDPASPCLTTICKRVSVKEYEEQASKATEDGIAEMIRYLEYNPTAYYNILRKRKREELENGGVFSWLKVKMMSAVLGDEFVEQIDPAEAKQKMSDLKEEMISAYNYSEDAKGSGRRYSKRLANRKDMNMKNKTKEIGNTLLPEPACTIVKNLEQDLLMSPDATPQIAPPKPPPPPPLPPLSFGERKPQQKCEKTTDKVKKTADISKEIRKEKLSTTINTRSKSREMKENKCESSGGNMQDLMECIKNPKLRSTLKPVNIGFTNDSPCQVRKKISKAKNEAEKDFPLFNQLLIEKFQNARSPQSPYLSDISSPSGSFSLSPY